MSDSSDPDVNFFNSVPKEDTKDFSADDISVELNSSEKDPFHHFTYKYKKPEQKL